ncbi:NAD-dependent epimerase/dehydratase family protein [Nocardia salmonicida]|uniref:NAD-dependent epimerase/dehydratase family protein n=1 Tax=Nocardia salmonicida TaxID=53431 RepID=UPI002E285571|nr:NAD-dependent epimerase/dehydratase family protein [Nocardia salmonicida]
MRIFLAGATGVIGSRLLPLLVGAGHEVAGLTRSPSKAAAVRAAGADAVVHDVFDADGLTTVVVDFAPDLVMHQLTDLPDDVARLATAGEANSRIRTEGTANLLAAATAAGAKRFLAQSIAWSPPAGRGDAIATHESAVLAVGGVVLRYGQFYGPGTYYESTPPAHPRIHVDTAAARTLDLLDAQTGVVVLVDPE